MSKGLPAYGGIDPSQTLLSNAGLVERSNFALGLKVKGSPFQVPCTWESGSPSPGQAVLRWEGSHQGRARWLLESKSGLRRPALNCALGTENSEVSSKRSQGVGSSRDVGSDLQVGGYKSDRHKVKSLWCWTCLEPSLRLHLYGAKGGEQEPLSTCHVVNNCSKSVLMLGKRALL